MTTPQGTPPQDPWGSDVPQTQAGVSEGIEAERSRAPRADTDPSDARPADARSADARRPAEGDPAADEAVLGVGTYDRILEPRSERRLPLGEGTWHQLARAYVRVQLISQGAVFVLVLAAAVVVQALTGFSWLWIPAGVILLVTAIGLVITPRQARSFGYQLRRDDLVFRRGILWQRVVAVPYGRMQLVDITHGPLDRGFGIAQLKLVTAAASTGVTIPGLTQEAAERLRDTLVAVAETRRTGL
ncbi:hypothetical protein DEU35_0949 [Microbacterium sp. AG157]|nr:hypothetical protein DEU35_0949 [Microbacterium sp. AG157]